MPRMMNIKDAVRHLLHKRSNPLSISCTPTRASHYDRTSSHTVARTKGAPVASHRQPQRQRTPLRIKLLRKTADTSSRRKARLTSVHASRLSSASSSTSSARPHSSISRRTRPHSNLQPSSSSSNQISSRSSKPIPTHHIHAVPRTATPPVFSEPIDMPDYISPGLRETIEKALGEAVVKSTTVRQEAAVGRFRKWGEEEGIPKKFMFPATEEVLCAFAASFLGRLASSTVQALISAIKNWHIRHRKPWNGGDRLKKVLKGVAKNAPPSKGERLPVTLDMLTKLKKGLNISNGRDAAVWMCATLATHGQLRLGELLPRATNPTMFDSSRYPTVDSISPKITDKGSRKIHLPWTKVAGKKGEDVLIPRQDSQVDPITALKNTIRTNDLTKSSPLTMYKAEDGSKRVLTAKSFMERCNSIWRKSGLPRFTGHSFRIGGTTIFLLAGVAPRVVQASGRWKSDAFRRYWRELSGIGSRHLENYDVPR